jgi:hypothetical protein
MHINSCHALLVTLMPYFIFQSHAMLYFSTLVMLCFSNSCDALFFNSCHALFFKLMWCIIWQIMWYFDFQTHVMHYLAIHVILWFSNSCDTMIFNSCDAFVFKFMSYWIHGYTFCKTIGSTPILFFKTTYRQTAFNIFQTHVNNQLHGWQINLMQYITILYQCIWTHVAM